MATAKKLPSGSYRVRVYDSKTQKYKSFTAKTKKAAELAAQEWLSEKTKEKSYDQNITVGEAILEYIANKENILSPSSIRGYEVMRKNAFGAIEDMKLSAVTEKDLQKWVNINAKKYAPKTISSQYGLLTATLRHNKINLDFGDILLPRREKHETAIPDVEQIGQILHMVEGTNVELPVTIAVTLGLRQSEIAALKWSDYNGRTLKIHAAKVPNKDNTYILKNTTKSQASTREIEVGALLKIRLDRAPRTSEFISPMLPSSVLRKFSRLCRENGLPHFTMHGQRHGNASLMLAQGVPDKYAMQRLGQSSPNMIKNIYQHLYDSKQQQVAQTVSSAFDDIYATKYDTKK